MDDRTLLERAALAAGWDRTKVDDRGWFYVCTYPDPPEWELWNPLTDDGDALRLAVRLGISIVFGANYVIVNDNVQMPTVNNANDPYAATRRAIVRAAAAMAKGDT